jgi:hypothetical protein
VATSYNGWPASDDKASIGVVSSDVFPGGAKSGDVTTVLSYVARQLHARVEPCIDGWNWGYTYKANANNPSQLSCHASGTAIDWNAPDHPNGSSGTFTSAQVTTIYQILAEVEGTVAWLQGYDEMHFEICVDANTLAYVAAILGDAAPPTGSTPPPTEQDWFDMATKKDLEDAVRGQLNIYFASGEGNPNTGRIVQAIHNSTPEIVDGVWNEVMPGNADGGTPEKNEPGRKARDTLGALMTMISRMYR